jgi:colanic acid biosynthesis glycosyl transferase WcaI
VITGIPHYPEWVPRHAKSDSAGNPQAHRYRHFVPRHANVMGRALYEITWLLSASRSVRRAQADVAIGVIPSLSGGVLAYLASRWMRIPFGLLFQDTMGAAARQSGYAGAIRFARIASRAETFISRRARSVAIVTDGFRGYLEGLGVRPDRIRRVRNWTRWTQSNETLDQCRDRLGWGPEDFICLHAGNMGKKQALDNLVETALLLRGTGIRIVLAGGGNDRSRLVDLVRARKARNVSFVDVQPAGAYEGMLQAADLLLINQRHSVAEMSLPSKISSYLAAGRPIVAAVAEISDTAREIRDSRAGKIVPPGDHRGLADMLLSLRADPDERQRMASNGLAFVQASLRPERVLQSYDSFLTSLMRESVPTTQSAAMSLGNDADLR